MPGRYWKACLVLVSVAISVVATFLFVARDFHEAMQLYNQAELVRVAEHVRYAYFMHPLPVARWELEQFDALLGSTPDSMISEPRLLKFHMFITSARLAKVCNELNDGAAYERHLARALDLGQLFETNFKGADSLFDFLEEYDQAERDRMATSRNGVEQPTASGAGRR